MKTSKLLISAVTTAALVGVIGMAVAQTSNMPANNSGGTVNSNTTGGPNNPMVPSNSTNTSVNDNSSSNTEPAPQADRG